MVVISVLTGVMGPSHFSLAVTKQEELVSVDGLAVGSGVRSRDGGGAGGHGGGEGDGDCDRFLFKEFEDDILYEFKGRERATD